MGWTNNPTNFVKTIEADLTKKQKEIAADVLQSVIVKSPVDSGAFRGSHRLSLGSPDNSYNAAEIDKNGSATIAKGLSVLSGLIPFSVVYIQTNSPYGNKIEYGQYPNPVKNGSYDKKTKQYVQKSESGYSKQAPQGVYGLTFNYIVQKYGG